MRILRLIPILLPLAAWGQAFQFEDQPFVSAPEIIFGVIEIAYVTNSYSFTNLAGITIPKEESPDKGEPYPSEIVISNFVGASIVKVTVTIVGLTNNSVAYVAAGLDGPNGTNAALMVMANWDAEVESDDPGGAWIASNVDLTFDDAAAAAIPSNTNPVISGTYKPTDYTAGGRIFGQFMEPAPAILFGSALANFAGRDPNGTWSLYVHNGDPWTVSYRMFLGAIKSWILTLQLQEEAP